MKVSIKSFDVEMDVKSKGIEFEVRDPGLPPISGPALKLEFGAG